MAQRGVTAMLQSNLKSLLKRNGYASIREFANKIEYRFETVRQLCNNDLVRIPAELIERVCIELKCTPNDLFTIVTEPNSAEGKTKSPTS